MYPYRTHCKQYSNFLSADFIILSANAMSNTRNTLAAIFFFGVPPKFDLYYLVHLSHCRIPQVAHDHGEKEHKDSDHMISAAGAGTDLLD